MFNSLEAIVGRIQNELDGGRPTDDTKLDKQHIADTVHKVRALLVREAIEKGMKPTYSYYQKVDCIPIVCRDIECNGIKSGKSMTIAELPELISAGEYTIEYLGTPDLCNSFEARHFKNGKLTRDAVWGGFISNAFYTRIQNEVQLYDLPTVNMKFLCVVGLFANPEGEDFDLGCDWSKPYPIPGDKLYKLELLVKKDLMQPMVQMPVDKQNNANPESSSPPRQSGRAKQG